MKAICSTRGSFDSRTRGWNRQCSIIVLPCIDIHFSPRSPAQSLAQADPHHNSRPFPTLGRRWVGSKLRRYSVIRGPSSMVSMKTICLGTHRQTSRGVGTISQRKGISIRTYSFRDSDCLLQLHVLTPYDRNNVHSNCNTVPLHYTPRQERQLKIFNLGKGE